MLFSPTLIVKRLVVIGSGKIVYDEKFHEGLNIISGCNGGGKSSVIQLLAYSLGYEVPVWKVEAGSCSRVYVEICLNGAAITAKRNLGSSKQSMDLCFKSFEDAKNSGPEEWQNFPYAINSARESFSQKIFSLLGMPETQSDANGNSVTVHQILRLIYSDQSNAAGSILNVEPFDSAFKREAVGDYLLGLNDDDIHALKVELVTHEKKLERVIDKLSAIFSVIGKTSYGQQLEGLDVAKSHYESEILQKRESVLKIKQLVLLSYANEKKVTENYAASSVELKNKLFECESDMRNLEYDIDDSESFVRELKSKSRAISDSLKLSSYIPEIKFNVCPCCFKPIEELGVDFCGLCGRETDKAKKNTNMLRMKNEIDIQLRESISLLSKKREKYAELDLKKKVLRAEMRKSLSKVSSVMTSVNSSEEKDLYALYREIGEIEEKIANLDRIKELKDSISLLTSEREFLQNKVSTIKDGLASSKNQFFMRASEVKALIAEQLIDILKRDVGAEKEFKDAADITFDFAANRVWVNGKGVFSESGTFFLNNAFHLALFMVSLKKEYVRIPRFMILDGIENGGMEDERSRNFQKIIYDKLSEAECDYQFIYTTKSILPQLDTDLYVVGSTYTEDEKSIRV